LLLLSRETTTTSPEKPGAAGSRIGVALSTHSVVPAGLEILHYELHFWLHNYNPGGMFSESPAG
jgi:hypothetical protein